ncbi:MAG: GTPase, partial [Burkholderiaceae bacterium]
MSESSTAAPANHHISLSLVSHTNAGKTTLARTLLGQDVGEIRDESHVTEIAERYTMVTTEQGDVLQLWDTPGFGDSARLAKRLENSANPLGWLVGQVWDRFSDRATYSSQQAIRNARDHADVVLYLVNASEDPQDAAYVEPEMRILAWTGKPVIVLLNQMGPPRPTDVEAADIAQWRTHLANQPMVKKVLALDAFARCWVQEGSLLDDIAGVLDPAHAASYQRLRDQWLSDRRQVFDDAIAALASGIANAASDIERVADAGLLSSVRDAGAAIGIGNSDASKARDAAMVSLAERWDKTNRETTDKLIALHGLSGSAAQQVLTRVDAHYAVHRKLSEGKAAIVGGVTTGALAGLKADIASGGMTLGGGMIAGGVIGALGAAGLAR